jgi:hypothetical protein
MEVIRYIHIEEGDPVYSPGDWFFHEGEWAQCAEVGENPDGTWSLSINFEVAGKPLPEQIGPFTSLAEAKHFLSEYFECPVEKGDPPSPEPD